MAKTQKVDTSKMREATADEKAAGFSWVPEGFEVEKPVTSAVWKPEPGDVRLVEVLGYEDKPSDPEYGGENQTYRLFTFSDLQTGEVFVAVMGGLFNTLHDQEKFVNGSRLALRYKGEKKLPNGFKAKDWEIAILK